MTPTQVQTLAEYNQKMNESVLRAASQLSDENRKRDTGAYFKSIHGTLNHILWADGHWLSRFEGRASPGGGYGHELSANFEEFSRMRAKMDAELKSWASGVTEQWLDGELSWRTLAGVDQRRPVWLVVSHLFNHATHHRGQISTLLFQQGVDVGVTDLPRVVTE